MFAIVEIFKIIQHMHSHTWKYSSRNFAIIYFRTGERNKDIAFHIIYLTVCQTKGIILTYTNSIKYSKTSNTHIQITINIFKIYSQISLFFSVFNSIKYLLQSLCVYLKSEYIKERDKYIFFKSKHTFAIQLHTKTEPDDFINRFSNI